jgi:biopolymer transport protein ExbD
MGRAKIKRGSTNVDMTAMCDVAFLLLSFFILTTKFKPAEAIDVTPPSSVASKLAPEKDAFLVSISKEGKVFISMSDAPMKEDIINALSQTRQLNYSAQDVENFKKANFVGVPLNQLKQFISLPPDQVKSVALTGVPYDSTNNELQAWINAAITAYKSRKVNFLIKGDNAAKYPAFKGVIDAFKKNEIFKYQLITNPEGIPEGSELQKKSLAGEKQEQ